jgi:DNA primase
MRAFGDSHKFFAQTFVAVGPDGLDPCDLRTAKGDQAVQAMIEGKKPLFEFAIKQKLAKFDLSTVEGRVGAARAAAPVIAGIRDAAMRPAYIRELAGWVSLDGNEVSALVEVAAKQVRSDSVANLRTGQPVAHDDSAALQVERENLAAEALNLNDPITRFERQVLEVLVQVPLAYSGDALSKIATVGFSNPTHNAILRTLLLVSNFQRTPDWLNQIAAAVPAELLQTLREIAAQTLPASDEAGLSRYAQGVVTKALMNALALEKAQLLAALRRVDVSENPEESARIQKALVELEQERRSLQS